MKNWRLEAIKKNLERITLQQKGTKQIKRADEGHRGVCRFRGLKEKKLEKDGTYSSREQGEADWQLCETDLQDFHYTIFEHKWAGIEGLGSNYKRSGLEFYSIMIFGLQLEQHVLYGPLFEQRMIWDPGIRVFKI
ncbi:hypothetical protein Tco_0922706 [Tanacetum coccineum]|uniref:Uncharacterized protein n=1 Tax=Tanacetum coccineum TaxID=301880 RepID=A0ABQ5D0E8_9ASTR